MDRTWVHMRIECRSRVSGLDLVPEPENVRCQTWPLERTFIDNDVAPDTSHELGLGDQLTLSLDQRHQNIERA